MSNTYLTAAELAQRIKYNVRTIRDQWMDTRLIEGRHYFRPMGGRRILFIWEVIEADMRKGSGDFLAIPMASGAVCKG
ncbi:MAG: hypothetical protein ACT4PZ_24800 [Panacagrimonas sp.]